MFHIALMVAHRWRVKQLSKGERVRGGGARARARAAAGDRASVRSRARVGTVVVVRYCRR